MKKVFLTLAFALGLTLAANAQTDEKPKKFNPMSVEGLQAVNATPEQVEKFKANKVEIDKKSRTVKQNTSLSDDEKKAEIKKLNGERMQYFWNEVVTQEQAKQLKQKQKEAATAAKASTN